MIWVLGIVVVVVLVGVVRQLRQGSLAERRELRRLRAVDGRQRPGLVAPHREQNSAGDGFAGFIDGFGGGF
jgi:hypothetical protein